MQQVYGRQNIKAVVAKSSIVRWLDWCGFRAPRGVTGKAMRAEGAYADESAPNPCRG